MIVNRLTRRTKTAGNAGEGSVAARVSFFVLLHVFWYLAITIGIPLLNRSTPKDGMFLRTGTVSSCQFIGQ